MGYTRVEGAIIFDPPLNWAEIKTSPFHEKNWTDPYGNDRKDVKLAVNIATMDTDEGTVQRITANMLVPVTEESYRAYDLVDHVREFVRAYGKGRKFTGRLDCTGEESPDLWRVEVVDGQVKTIRAAIVWPEDIADLAAAVKGWMSIQSEDQPDFDEKAIGAASAASMYVRRITEAHNKTDRY